MQSRILVIDDEPEIRRFLDIGLKSQQFAVLEAATATEGLGLAATGKPDLVILDLGLPDMGGMDVLRNLRTWSRIPVIVLSVRQEEREKVEAFDAGASDYVTKPFGMAELLARVRAHLRDQPAQDAGSPVLRVGELEMDLSARRVTLRGERISLTPKEYQVLQILMQNAGKVVTHRYMIERVWGDAHGGDNQYLRIYIRQLRRKIERDRVRDMYIHNEPGVGYRLEHIGF
jgi:two-component system KDP operon response regulator KdpE